MLKRPSSCSEEACCLSARRALLLKHTAMATPARHLLDKEHVERAQVELSTRENGTLRDLLTVLELQPEAAAMAPGLKVPWRPY